MKRVTGIGGVFFKAKDPAALQSWYREHLGITPKPDGYVFFDWREHDAPERAGGTAWSLFRQDTKYFEPSDSPFMINYRVDDLDALLEALRAEGVWIDEKREEAEYGRFAWIMDPEGNRIELWEPPRGDLA